MHILPLAGKIMPRKLYQSRIFFPLAQDAVNSMLVTQDIIYFVDGFIV